MDALTELAAWLTAQGGHCRGAQPRTGGGRRWLAAPGPAVDGDELAFVPRAAIITREAMRRSSVGQQIHEANLTLSSPHGAAAAWLAVEALRPTTPWAPYFATLPSSVDEFPAVALTDPHGLLAGTFAGAAVAAMAAAIHGDLRALRRIRLMAPVEDADFAWARMCIGSRLFQLSIDGIATAALVPLCDLLDHAADAATRWSFEDDRDGFVLRAARPVAADCELTTSYGAKPNRQLLAQYGFALDDNPHDEIELRGFRVRRDPDRADGLALGAALLTSAGGDRGAARAALADEVAAVAARYPTVIEPVDGDGPTRFLAAARRGELAVVAAWTALVAGPELDGYFERAATAAARSPAMVAA